MSVTIFIMHVRILRNGSYAYVLRLSKHKTASAYDQKIPQSHTANQPTAPLLLKSLLKARNSVGTKRPTKHAVIQ